MKPELNANQMRKIIFGLEFAVCAIKVFYYDVASFYFKIRVCVPNYPAYMNLVATVGRHKYNVVYLQIIHRKCSSATVCTAKIAVRSVSVTAKALRLTT